MIILAPAPLTEVSKYVLVCVDTASDLTQAFPCHRAKQVATTRSGVCVWMLGVPCMDVPCMDALVEQTLIRGHILKVMI